MSHNERGPRRSRDEARGRRRSITTAATIAATHSPLVGDASLGPSQLLRGTSRVYLPREERPSMTVTIRLARDLDLGLEVVTEAASIKPA